MLLKPEDRSCDQPMLLHLLLSNSGPSQSMSWGDKDLRDADHPLSGAVDYPKLPAFHSHFLAISCLD